MNDQGHTNATAKLILVQGLVTASQADGPGIAPGALSRRAKAMAEHGEALGVLHYEWIEGRGKALANRLLRLARGTSRAVDAVEIIELDEVTARASLADELARKRWQELLSCAPYGFDAERSFVLMGAPLQLIQGSTSGQRVLWFGRGLSQLGEAEFIEHYTGHHGPLVAGHAQVLGLRRYRQVPSEQGELCNTLRNLGLGQAAAPSVFAELVMGAPPLKLASLRARRVATREIAADEKRHIDFRRSMLMLA